MDNVHLSLSLSLSLPPSLSVCLSVCLSPVASRAFRVATWYWRCCRLYINRWLATDMCGLRTVHSRTLIHMYCYDLWTRTWLICTDMPTFRTRMQQSSGIGAWTYRIDRQGDTLVWEFSSSSRVLDSIDQTILLCSFHRAMLRRARYCYCIFSVCPCVRLSVPDVEVSWSHRLEIFKK